MSKNTRKTSQAQRDKTNISVAKKLKEAGIISKQAKLHSGRYISKGVLKKVREYKASADLGYKAVTVPKEIARAAKERGFQVVQGNKIIGPNTKTFKKRLKEGALTGVRPVKGGMMEEVILPHNVMDMQSLVSQLESGIDTLKLPEEYFAFTYHGNESWRPFPNTQKMLDYLRNYRGIFDINGSMKPEDLQEEFANFTIFRMHPNSQVQNIPGPKRRRERAKRRKMEAIANGTYVAPPRTRKTRKEWMATLDPATQERLRKKDAERTTKRRKQEALKPEFKAKEAERKREYRKKLKSLKKD